MLFLYSIVIFFYNAFITAASLFSSKAKLWVVGRKNWRKKLTANTPANGFDLWMHCSSLGEFEQGRPILETFRNDHPNSKILLSFYSPSGYEIRKHYKVVDYVSYLPIDTKKNANDWLRITRPKKTIFVKYDFWFHFLNAIKNSSTKAILVSAVFHESHFFNSWIGKKMQASLKAFEAIFLQRKPAFKVEDSVITRIVGDTRVDRVLAIQKENNLGHSILEWAKDQKIMIWGSIWDSDFFALKIALEEGLKNWKHIIAPHDPSSNNINSIRQICGSKHQLLSEPIFSQNNIIIVDSVGQLSGLYKLGSASYIGGGFGQGIQNTLEPSPKYHNFPEAIEGINSGAIFSINSAEDFKKVATAINQSDFLKTAQEACAKYVQSNAGATAVIMQYLE